jgi:predicted NAD/FAD-binding protein
MGAAIWSSRPVDMLSFPARFFVEFFANHGFLSVNDHPDVAGDSRRLARICQAADGAVRRAHSPEHAGGLAAAPAAKVVLRLKNGTVEHFDQVFIACHSDQALKLLSDPSPRSATSWAPSLPGERSPAAHRRPAHAAPRARLGGMELSPADRAYERVTVTYNMNILQSLTRRCSSC